MQGSRDDEAAFQDSLRFAEEMVDAFAEGARLYWRLWGPLGEPMMRGIDAWADMQRGYLTWVREAYKPEDDPSFLEGLWLRLAAHS